VNTVQADTPRSGSRVSAHWFIDETKAHGLTFVIVEVESDKVGRVRAQMAKLRRKGQRAVHFNAESKTSKTQILAEIRSLPLTATVIRIKAVHDYPNARAAGITAVAKLALADHPSRIVFERDATQERNDRRTLSSFLRTTPTIEYQHVDRASDPILWVADALAWALQRGGAWQQAITPLITRTLDV